MILTSLNSENSFLSSLNDLKNKYSSVLEKTIESDFDIPRINQFPDKEKVEHLFD